MNISSKGGTGHDDAIYLFDNKRDGKLTTLFFLLKRPIYDSKSLLYRLSSSLSSNPPGKGFFFCRPLFFLISLYIFYKGFTAHGKTRIPPNFLLMKL